VSQEHVEIVTRVVDAWNRGDLNAWLELFDDYVVWVPVSDHPDPEPLHGREGVLSFAEQWLEPWDYYEMETDELIERGDEVLWTARHRARKADGLEMDVRMSAIFALAHSKIVQIRWFWGREEALAAGEADVDDR
jgi:ketosteroid isomerase-like protein